MKRTNASKKAITLQYIADKAGCSENTASLALRDSKRISPKRREQIRKIARELGYLHRHAARDLATKRSGIIGIYTHALYDAVRTELVNSLVAELHTAGYKPMLGLGYGHKGPWHNSPWLNTFRNMQVGAIVVVAERVSELPNWASDIPTILVNCRPKDSLSCDYIALDRREGAKQAIEYLWERGHKRMLVASRTKHPFTEGCMQILRAAGSQPYHVDISPPATSAQLSRVKRCVFREKNRPEAIIFGNVGIAVKSVGQLRKAKLKVPEEMAVVAYNYSPWADMVEVPLTAIEQPIDQLAALAIKLTKDRLKNPDAPYTHITLPHKLVIRKST